MSNFKARHYNEKIISQIDIAIDNAAQGDEINLLKAMRARMVSIKDQASKEGMRYAFITMEPVRLTKAQRLFASLAPSTAITRIHLWMGVKKKRFMGAGRSLHVDLAHQWLAGENSQRL